MLPPWITSTSFGSLHPPRYRTATKTKEIHRLAAHSLAYTCAISYADQDSGLGPVQMKMRGNGRRWMEVG